MMTILRLELIRAVRDRRFWFWALAGVPVLLPAAIVLLAFAFASTGTIEPQAVRPVVATNASDGAVLTAFRSAEVPVQTLNSRQAVLNAVKNGDFSVGVVDVSQEPGESMAATILGNVKARELPVYRQTEEILNTLAIDRRRELMESLDFAGPSFDLLVDPISIREERVPDRLPSGLVQLVSLAWVGLLVFPYLLLTWNGGSKILTDRLEGYLSPINASALAPWKWLVARWLALATIGTGLLIYSALLFAVYMRAFSVFADVLVDQGILESLSEASSLSARAYLVDTVAMWRGTSIVSYALWIFGGAVQIAALCALLTWGSARASSLAQFRLFEMAPFLLVFLIPLMGLGALGNGIGGASWIPGLNTVLSIEHMVDGGYPDGAFFSTLGIVLLTNILLIAFCLIPGMFAMRNERLWST